MHYLDYNEKKQHGTGSFPLEYYHVDATHPRYHMPYHWHQEYEIIRILEGNFAISLDSEEITATTGDVLFIHDGVIHGGTPDQCVYECIVFDIQLLMTGSETCRNLIRPLADHRLLVQPLLPAADSINRLFNTASLNFLGKELCLTGALYEFFGNLYHHSLIVKNSLIPNPYFQKKHKKMEQLRSVLQYIETNYAASITLDELSAQAGMSPKYFCRYFESVIHRTPMEYLNYYRIERACCELATSDIPITEVGYNCGFHDTSYFIRIFKREKGVTPKKYQNGLAE